MKKILGLLLILSMILSYAAAEEIQFGETVYLFPQEEEIQGNFSLQVYGQSIDPDTFETFRQENLSGAVFGVYAQNADGKMIPLPDPESPVKNWIVTTENQSISMQLPENVQLYLCLLQAPENYVKYSDAPEYQPIVVPGDMEYPLCRAGMTGVYLTVCGSDGVALEAAEFVRYGVMHRNTFINSPKLLNKFYQMRTRQWLRPLFLYAAFATQYINITQDLGLVLSYHHSFPSHLFPLVLFFYRKICPFR